MTTCASLQIRQGRFLLSTYHLAWRIHSILGYFRLHIFGPVLYPCPLCLSSCPSVCRDCAICLYLCLALYVCLYSLFVSCVPVRWLESCSGPCSPCVCVCICRCLCVCLCLCVYLCQDCVVCTCALVGRLFGSPLSFPHEHFTVWPATCEHSFDKNQKHPEFKELQD